MSDYPYDYEDQDIDVVDTYRQRERAGRGQGMGTVIEGANKLARIQRKQQLRDIEFRLGTQIDNYCNEIINIDSTYRNIITNDDRGIIIDIFQSLERKEYRNTYAFVLGYILRKTQDINLINNIIIETDQQGITDVDVIRYYRLIS